MERVRLQPDSLTGRTCSYDAKNSTKEDEREGGLGGVVPDHKVEMAFLGSNTAGDWALGDFWGPLGNETRAWLDSLVTGAPTVHTTPQQARINLETTIAIERAVETGQPVRLPLQSEH